MTAPEELAGIGPGMRVLDVDSSILILAYPGSAVSK